MLLIAPVKGMNTSKKIGLSVREAGWLLQKSEGQIRGMLRRGELTYVVERRRIDPVSVRPRLGGDFLRVLLDVVLAGEIEVPRPERRYGPPAPLFPGLLEFALTTGFLARDEEIEAVMNELAGDLGPELLRPSTPDEVTEPSVR